MVIIYNLHLCTSFIVLTVPKPNGRKQCSESRNTGEKWLRSTFRSAAEAPDEHRSPSPWSGARGDFNKQCRQPFINVNDIYLLKAVTTVKKSH